MMVAQTFIAGDATSQKREDQCQRGQQWGGIANIAPFRWPLQLQNAGLDGPLVFRSRALLRLLRVEAPRMVHVPKNKATGESH